MPSRRARLKLARWLGYIGWTALGVFLLDRYCGGGSLNPIGDLWAPYLVVTVAWGIGAASDAWLAV